MFISKITVSHQTALRMSWDSGSYAVHQFLWGIFSDGPDRRRDFLFRADERRSDILVFLAVSAREPVIQLEGVTVETKRYDPTLHVGQLLAFAVHLNPSIRSKTDGRRHDAIMHARYRAPDAMRDLWSPIQLYLEARQPVLGCRFLPESLQVERYCQEKIRRRGVEVRFSTCEVSGVLEVVEPQLFRETLFRGIGKQKAFGCGLLLVRRITANVAAA